MQGTGDERGRSETPSGGWGDTTPGEAQPASVGKRIGAYIIDWILVTVVTFIVGLLIFGAGMIGMGMNAPGAQAAGPRTTITGLVALLIGLAYFVLLEARGGQTLAKKMLSIRSVKADGSAMDVGAAFKRCIWFFVGSIVGLIPGLLGGALGALVGLVVLIGLLVTTVTDKPWNRGFHDKFADTKVVGA